MFEAVLLDFDGVIMPADLVAKALSKILRQKGFDVDENFVIMHIYGHRLIDVGTELFGLSVDELKRIRDEYHEEYIKIAKRTKPLPGAYDTFSICKENGIKVAIISTKMRKETLPIIKSLGLEPDTCVFQEDVKHVKPDPEPILKACDALGVDPSGAAMVGDHVSDIKCAINAGSYPVGVLTGVSNKSELLSAGAREVFNSLIDFNNWLLEKIDI